MDVETGKSLPRNKEGEICFKGNMIMNGYRNNIDATKLTIDQDGWLHTGDIGYFDEDGDLFVVDRIKELIKYKGFQVRTSLNSTDFLVCVCVREKEGAYLINNTRDCSCRRLLLLNWKQSCTLTRQ